MIRDRVDGVGHSPGCQTLLQIVVRAVIPSSPPAWTSSAGMLSTPADSPFFSDCTAASTSLRRMGWSSSVSVWVQFSTDGSPLTLWPQGFEYVRIQLCRVCLEYVRIQPRMLCLEYVRIQPCRVCLEYVRIQACMLCLEYVRIQPCMLCLEYGRIQPCMLCLEYDRIQP